MFYLIFYDYKDDVKKVSLARLLKKERHLPLSEAKDAVDKLMEGKTIFFNFKSKAELSRVRKEAILLGILTKELRLPLLLYKTTRRRKNQKTNQQPKLVSKEKLELKKVVMV